MSVYQATQSFHTVREDGAEEFVPKGKVFPDTHPYVQRDKTGVLFEELNFEPAPAVKPAPPAKAI
jgi:hypothetical protein